MEWLINRRRMMFNKAVPPAYLTFEDSRVWEICCYRWGDTYDLQEVDGQGGILSNGTLIGSSSGVYTDYMFASSYAISAHTGTPAVSARTIQYRIELEVKSGSQTAAGAPWSVPTQSSSSNNCFCVEQYNLGMNKTSLLSITASQWEDSSYWASQSTLVSDGNSKYHCNVTTNTSCQYLRLFMRGDSNVIVNWKIVSVGVTKLPLGITLKQCKAVTSMYNIFTLGNYRFNFLIERFDEFQYFTSITNSWSFMYLENLKKLTLPQSVTTIPSEALYGISLSESTNFKVPEGCTTYENHAIGRGNCHIVTLDLPSTSTSFTGNFMYGAPDIQTIIIRATTPPTVASNTLSSIPSRVQFYVPDDSVEAYQTASSWSSYASRIHPLSEYVES